MSTSHAAPELLVTVAPRQRRLLEVLACPSCLGDIAFRDATVQQGWVAFADIMCPTCGDRVGVVDQFRPSFLERELDARPEGDRSSTGIRQPVDLDGPAVARTGDWTRMHAGYEARGDQSWATLSIQAGGTGVAVTFYGHNFSGIAELRVDDMTPVLIDGFREQHESHTTVIDGLDNRPHRIQIRATGDKRAEAQGAWVVVQGVERIVPLAESHPPAVAAINRGNGYPPRFVELVEAMSADGLALDAGGGDRSFGDARVYNLEYLRFELPDFYGDGHHLPIRSGAFDVVSSQAVLEHVQDPQRIIDELIRILKPGGTLYVEAAFMQPIHAVPSHYFNITPHGLSHLCRALDEIASGAGGGMSDSVGWWCQIANAEQKLGSPRFQLLLSLLRDIDLQLTPDELRNFAFYVWFEGRKP